ncbi:PHP domain-containing protein [candidate division NPL-UPA2 bacterium]|nr:PHP domain-containing protein [candidate division NPL-UPA2 bacterium]
MSDRKQCKFVRFLHSSWSDINCDLHVHTRKTDGHADVEQIMAHAVERNLAKIAFTEHVRRDTRWFGEFTGLVRATQERFSQLEVLLGCEAKALDPKGSLDATVEILAKCDIVLGSVHRFPDGLGGYIDFATLTPERFAQIEFDLAIGLLEAAPINVLAHPGGMYSKRHSDFPSNLMRKILQKSLERGIAVEINTSYLRDVPAFLRLCADVNPYVSVGSDMHRLEQLGECRDQLRMYGIGVS